MFSISCGVFVAILRETLFPAVSLLQFCERRCRNSARTSQEIGMSFSLGPGWPPATARVVTGLTRHLHYGLSVPLTHP